MQKVNWYALSSLPFRRMKEERQAFSRRLADAMRDAGYEPRPSVLFRLFNSRYPGESVSFQSVSRWLNARSIPEQDKLQVLAALFGIEPHRLRFGMGQASRHAADPHTAWQPQPTQQDRETFDAYLALPPTQRKLVRELIAALRQPLR